MMTFQSLLHSGKGLCSWGILQHDQEESCSAAPQPVQACTVTFTYATLQLLDGATLLLQYAVCPLHSLSALAIA